MNEIRTPCPSCGGKHLFIGTGGHLTCSWLECPEPRVERAIATLNRENGLLRGKVSDMCKDLLDTDEEAQKEIDALLAAEEPE